MSTTRRGLELEQLLDQCQPECERRDKAVTVADSWLRIIEAERDKAKADHAANDAALQAAKDRAPWASMDYRNMALPGHEDGDPPHEWYAEFYAEKRARKRLDQLESEADTANQDLRKAQKKKADAEDQMNAWRAELAALEQAVAVA